MELKPQNTGPRPDIPSPEPAPAVSFERIREMASRPLGRLTSTALAVLSFASLLAGRPAEAAVHEPSASQLSLELKDRAGNGGFTLDIAPNLDRFNPTARPATAVTDPFLKEYIEHPTSLDTDESGDPSALPPEMRIPHNAPTIQDQSRFLHWGTSQLSRPEMLKAAGIDDLSKATPKQLVLLCTAVVADNLRYDYTQNTLDPAAEIKVHARQDMVPVDTLLEGRASVVCSQIARCEAVLFEKVFRAQFPTQLANLHIRVANNLLDHHAWDQVLDVTAGNRATSVYIDPTRVIDTNDLGRADQVVGNETITDIVQDIDQDLRIQLPLSRRTLEDIESPVLEAALAADRTRQAEHSHVWDQFEAYQQNLMVAIANHKEAIAASPALADRVRSLIAAMDANSSSECSDAEWNVSRLPLITQAIDICGAVGAQKEKTHLLELYVQGSLPTVEK